MPAIPFVQVNTLFYWGTFYERHINRAISEADHKSRVKVCKEINDGDKLSR